MKNFLSFTLAMIALSACAFKTGGLDNRSACVSVASSPAVSAMESFTENVFPVVRSYCANCHGNAQSPLFAKAQAIDSFSAAQPLLILTGGESRLELKAGDGHCGANCNNKAAIRSAVQAYHEALKETTTAVSENTCAVEDFREDGRFATEALSLDTVQQTSEKEFTVGMDAEDEALPEEFKNVKIMAVLKGYTTATDAQKGSLIIKNIRVISPDVSFKLTGLLFAINGSLIHTASAFEDLVVDVAQTGSTSTTSAPTTIASGSTLISANWGSGGDSIRITFRRAD